MLFSVAAWSLLAVPTTIFAHDDESKSTLDEVVVSTTRTQKRLSDEPTRVEVLNEEELSEKLTMNPADVSMLLNETSGLRVQVTSPGLGSANVRIQGLSGRYTQVLADGLPLYGGQTGGIGLFQVPPLDLKQVEVVKGSASALYGASALGGVINLISRKPDGTQELLLNQTNRNGTDGAIWLSSDPSNDGWSYSLISTLNRQSMQDIDHDGWADMSHYERANIRPRLHWQNDDGAELMTTIGAMYEDRSGGTIKGGLVATGDPLGTSFVEALKSNRFDVGLNGRWPLTKSLSLLLRGSAMRREQRQTFGLDSAKTRSNTQFAESAIAGVYGNHSWIVGAALQRDDYRNEQLPQFDFAHTVPGLFIQDEHEVNTALTVSLSARYDDHDEFGSFVSPRLAALWRPGGPDSAWRTRFSLGSGFFAPTVLTEETEATGLFRILLPTGLKAEKSKGGSLDIGRTWSIGEASLDSNVSFFASRIDNSVGLVQVSSAPPRFIHSNAIEPTKTEGGELSLRWRLEPFVVNLGYAFVDSSEVGAGENVRRTVPLNPKHSISFTAMWEKHGVGRAGFEAYYTGRQTLEDNPYRTESPSFVTLGFMMEHHFGPARVFLNAENFTDRRLTRTHPLVLPARADDGRWTTDTWGALDGRVFNLGVRWEL